MRNVRIICSKKDRMKFVSHLDMNRYFTRLVKVSQVPAWHTEGFNKHLYVTFALPLSLGMTTDYDVLDLKITDDDFTDEMVVDALNKNSAEGLKFLSAGPILMKTTELSFAKYSLLYSDDDIELLKKFESMLNGNVIIAQKKGKKGKVTELNLAEKIKSIKTQLEGNELKVEVVLPAGNIENINPSLFADAFSSAGNRKPQVYLVNRDMLYNAEMEIFK